MKTRARYLQGSTIRRNFYGELAVLIRDGGRKIGNGNIDTGGSYEIKTLTKAYSGLYKGIAEDMEKKQKAAQAFAKSFVPKTNFGIWLRNIVFKSMSLPFVSGLVLNQFKDRELKLKEY